MAGKLILVFGPSGSGKGELISHIRETFPDILFPTSATTRPMRPGEREGEVYEFISHEEFERRALAGEFLEWAQFGGNLYGTLKSSILPALEKGSVIVREVDVQGVRAIRELLLKEQMSVIFIFAGPWEGLETRIRTRAPISEDELMRRKARYQDELSYRTEADFEVENPEGQLEGAKERIESLVREIIAK